MIQMIVVEGMWFLIDSGRCLNEPVCVVSVQMYLFAACSVHNRECTTRLHLNNLDLFTYIISQNLC